MKAAPKLEAKGDLWVKGSGRDGTRGDVHVANKNVHPVFAPQFPETRHRAHVPRKSAYVTTLITREKKSQRCLVS